MKNNTTELIFILDRSGSMEGLEKDTIGGFNALVKQQKKRRGRALSPPSYLILSAKSYMTACLWKLFRI